MSWFLDKCVCVCPLKFKPKAHPKPETWPRHLACDSKVYPIGIHCFFVQGEDFQERSWGWDSPRSEVPKLKNPPFVEWKIHGSNQTEYWCLVYFFAPFGWLTSRFSAMNGNGILYNTIMFYQEALFESYCWPWFELKIVSTILINQGFIQPWVVSIAALCFAWTVAP